MGIPAVKSHFLGRYLAVVPNNYSKHRILNELIFDGVFCQCLKLSDYDLQTDTQYSAAQK
jgi:hypothetical protein